MGLSIASDELMLFFPMSDPETLTNVVPIPIPSHSCFISNIFRLFQRNRSETSEQNVFHSVVYVSDHWWEHVLFFVFSLSLSRFHFVRRRGAQKQICHNKRLRMFRLYTGVGDRWGLTLCVDSEVHFQVFRLPAFSHSLDLSSWALSVSFSIRFLTPFFSYPSLFTPPCLSVVFFLVQFLYHSG